MQDPSSAASTAEPSGPPNAPADASKRSRRWIIFQGIFVVLFGICLPVVVLAVELTSRWCTEEFLDPLPTPLHTFLVALVPLTNGASLAPATQRYPRLLRVAQGMAIAVALVYSAIFLPLAPFALLALIFFGLGLLGLSPMLALLATFFAHRLTCGPKVRYRLLKVPPMLVGGIAATVLLVVPMVQPIVFYRYLERASLPDHDIAVEAIQRLRATHAEPLIGQRCARLYNRHNEDSPLTLSFLAKDIPRDKAAEIYYRVTGEPCGALRGDDADSTFRQSRDRVSMSDAFTEGPPLGAELRLAESRIDGSIDPTAALGYLEWTWLIHNTVEVPREGRAELTLPAKSVVSRVTLWVNGEPQEAAFAEQRQVRQAYERVVNRRRDPLLVTQLGPDRIEVRFFPVPANGEMRLRVGVTTPLILLDSTSAVLGLPRIDHRNFAVATKHQLWIEAKTPFRFRQTRAGSVSGVFKLDGAFDDETQRGPDAHLTFELPTQPTVAWTRDPLDSAYVITQRIEPATQTPPSRVVLVVDTSVGQDAAVKALVRALPDFPRGIPLEILGASDDVHRLVTLAPATPDVLERAAKSLSAVKTQGGANNVAALSEALEQCNATARSTVLWLHGAQPVRLDGAERLRQFLERANSPITLYSLASRPGRNVLRDELDEYCAFVPLDSTTGTEDALRLLFRSWSQVPRLDVVRFREPAGASPLSVDTQTSDHLARLWARDEVERLALASHREDAIRLASVHKLVTSVSGAVVLETAQQYEDAALTPPSPDRVPSVPEPEVVVVLICAIGCLLAYALLLRRRCQCFAR